VTERLPPPPPLPQLRQGDVFRVRAGQTFGRVYFTAGTHPAAWDGFRSYGPVATMRFDHHPPPERNHITRSFSYVAPSVKHDSSSMDPLVACVCECFAATRTIDVRSGAPWFVLWSTARSLRLLDVVDSAWITRVGGNAAISSGARTMSRRWSRAIYRTYDNVDGIYYETSTVPMSRSVALYERAQRAVPDRYAVAAPLTHPGLRAPLRRIAHDFGMDLVL
jgi:hypothetical protein